MRLRDTLTIFAASKKKDEGTPPFRNQTGNVRLRFADAAEEGSPVFLHHLLPSFEKDKGFKVPHGMQAKSPPGWSKAIERMKQSGMPANKAFALAWYGHKKGYKPHPVTEKKKEMAGVDKDSLPQVHIHVGKEKKGDTAGKKKAAKSG